MTLWRISNHAVLDGGGGLRTSGRWHTRGRRVVYCAPNPAAALLEIMVHLEIDIEDLPASLRYLEIDAPDSISREMLDVGGLGRSWRTNTVSTRQAGDVWLRSGRTVLLEVPSVIVPATFNVLINPQHPGSSRIRIARIREQQFDPRLVG